jgi:hypothetical protein
MEEVHVLIEIMGGTVVCVSGNENVRVGIFDHDNFENDPKRYHEEEGSVGWYEVDQVKTKEEIEAHTEELVQEYISKINKSTE